ncbi:MAG TPA: methylated-DNA--[protein]-cysteine S-methyltransferase [Rhizomicrobium sp.]|jgi:methylated-DNA-[protein]-cysteine S-methyltransferase
MAEPRTFFVDRVKTPIDGLLIVADEAGALRVLAFDDGDERWRPFFERSHPKAKLVSRHDPFGLSKQLAAYFDGDMEALARIPVAFDGTAFQTCVWHALQTIPSGTTTSYGALAQRIGKPRAVRAVGLANGSNPIAVVVPCHRVIGSDGSLTGYGGGLPRKRWLLAHEARHATKSFQLENRT